MKRRLIREAISEEQQEQYLDMFASIPADESKRIREAIKECLEKYAPGLVFTGGFALLGIMVLTIGIKFKSWQTTLAGFAMLATGGTMIGIAERKSILLCAAKKLGMDLGDMLNKMRGDEEETSEMMPESRRVVKLTESDLNRIVRRIIKEDEMMTGPSKGFTIAGLYKKSGYSAPLPQRLVISKVKGKIKVDGIDKSVGSVSTSSKIECMGDCEIMFRDVQDLGEISITVTNGKPKLFVTSE
jgi:hypothetical protein